MSQEIKASGNIVVENCKFCYHQNLILLENVDTDNTLKFSMVFLMEKVKIVLLVPEMMIINLDHY